MTNEHDAWTSFFQTGSVLDYLQYKSIQKAKEAAYNANKANSEVKDEVFDNGTDTKTTEYR